ncbi:hypothetical protein ACIX1W_11965 [Bacteroides fragilis]|uniref:hypothetical protein n=1 Tax=Bacteroides fragilis TaxID=817 RepID=UPI0032EA9C61|nr:hypothetical protein [Bacteroides fragilis]MCS3168946.1 hypothetical protein [Bacteroides fragilis]
MKGSGYRSFSIRNIHRPFPPFTALHSSFIAYRSPLIIHCLSFTAYRPSFFLLSENEQFVRRRTSSGIIIRKYPEGGQ